MHGRVRAWRTDCKLWALRACGDVAADVLLPALPPLLTPTAAAASAGASTLRPCMQHVCRRHPRHCRRRRAWLAGWRRPGRQPWRRRHHAGAPGVWRGVAPAARDQLERHGRRARRTLCMRACARVCMHASAGAAASPPAAGTCTDTACTRDALLLLACCPPGVTWSRSCCMDARGTPLLSDAYGAPLTFSGAANDHSLAGVMSGSYRCEWGCECAHRMHCAHA